LDFDVRDLNGTKRAIAVRSHASNFLNQFDSGGIALAENGVLAIQLGRPN
jgi:hypothetical protein